jgi:hypothetical protein
LPVFYGEPVIFRVVYDGTGNEYGGAGNICDTWWVESVTRNPASRVFCSVLLAGLAGWLATPNILNQSIDMSNDKTYFKHAQSFIDQIQFCWLNQYFPCVSFENIHLIQQNWIWNAVDIYFYLHNCCTSSIFSRISINWS